MVFYRLSVILSVVRGPLSAGKVCKCANSRTCKLYQRTRVPSLRSGLRKDGKTPSTVHANASVNATDLTETALRTADAWNPTGLPARRAGLWFDDNGMNGHGAGRQCCRQES